MACWTLLVRKSRMFIEIGLEWSLGNRRLYPRGLVGVIRSFFRACKAAVRGVVKPALLTAAMVAPECEPVRLTFKIAPAPKSRHSVTSQSRGEGPCRRGITQIRMYW